MSCPAAYFIYVAYTTFLSRMSIGCFLYYLCHLFTYATSFESLKMEHSFMFVMDLTQFMIIINKIEPNN